MVKSRLDVLLVQKGLAESRTRAQALVMEGKVRVDGQVETKASRQVSAEASVEVEAPPRFVSRGGEKLEGAFRLWGSEEVRVKSEELRMANSSDSHKDVGHHNSSLFTLHSSLDVVGKTCIDVGSSTGGFTDCLLQHGAEFVMAVDVGTNQLAYKLRVDPRVWVKENYNARYMTAADLPRVPEVAVTDVSFISLELILPPINNVLASGGRIVALIKPQFEVGKGRAPGGLVRDEKLRIEARDKIVKFATEELGLELLGLEESPIRGKEMGNVEYLSYWRKP